MSILKSLIYMNNMVFHYTAILKVNYFLQIIVLIKKYVSCKHTENLADSWYGSY